MKALLVKKLNFLLLAGLLFIGACHQGEKQQLNSDTVTIEQVQYPGGEATVIQPPLPGSGMMVN